MAPDRDLTKLAPRFGLAVLNAMNECWRNGFDPIIHEGQRSDDLQRHYYARGVSKARSSLQSWHGYGLAVDVISKRHAWGAPVDWWEGVAAIFKRHGLDWGGDWKRFVDKPHFQWGTLRASPSHRAVKLLREGGVEAVWREVGAS